MLAILYELEITDSWLHFTHGMSTKVFELYIPQLGLAMNDHNDGNFFFSSDNRYNEAKQIDEMSLDPSLTRDLRTIRDCLALTSNPKKRTLQKLKQLKSKIPKPTNKDKKNGSARRQDRFDDFL